MVHLLLGVIYLAFISLGLPDSLLGSAWPSIYGETGGAGFLCGHHLDDYLGGDHPLQPQQRPPHHKLGPGRVTAFSVALTALALFGFSTASSFWMLCLWAVPYGLGAGSVDAALNNYVALHYASRHMSWLHCMWGVGTLVGPNLISYALSGGQGWQMGYRIISLMQVVLTAVLLFSLPLWKASACRCAGCGIRQSGSQPAAGGTGFREQKAPFWPFSAIVRWNRPPVCGQAAIWSFTAAFQLNGPPAWWGCSILASQWVGLSVAL